VLPSRCLVRLWISCVRSASLQPVKLVKIDVEGAELFVLRDMKMIVREMREL